MYMCMYTFYNGHTIKAVKQRHVIAHELPFFILKQSWEYQTTLTPYQTSKPVNM